MMKKYFIAIVPDAELSERITATRRMYLPGLNAKDEHKKFPHITVQHTFSRTEEIESELNLQLNQLSKSISPFPITLSCMGHFDSRIIYITVEISPELRRLHSEVKNLLRNKMNFSQEEVSTAFTPHITLEKKIRKEDFNGYWKNIMGIEFKEDFIAGSLSLLRHTGIKWNEVSTYSFT